jgi:hypothetical protein
MKLVAYGAMEEMDEARLHAAGGILPSTGEGTYGHTHSMSSELTEMVA